MCAAYTKYKYLRPGLNERSLEELLSVSNRYSSFIIKLHRELDLLYAVYLLVLPLKMLSVKCFLHYFGG